VGAAGWGPEVSTDHAMPRLTMPGEYEPDPVPAEAAPAPAAAAPTPEPNREPFPGAAPGLPEPSAEPVPEQIAGGPGTTGILVPVVTAPPARISTAGHALRSFRAWATRVAADQKTHHSFWAWLWAQVWEKKPDSLEEHASYINSRRWLQDYMTGWVRAFCEWENVIWAVTIGRTLKLTGNSISRIGERQLRFWLAIAGVGLASIVYLAAH
jgi:hypothetical protein